MNNKIRNPEVKKIIASIEQIPTLPIVSQQIMKLLNDEDVAINEITEVIEKNPGRHALSGGCQGITEMAFPQARHCAGLLSPFTLARQKPLLRFNHYLYGQCNSQSHRLYQPGFRTSAGH